MDTLGLIIDLPRVAAYDIIEARAWVKELDMLTVKGYDVKKYRVQAIKFLNSALDLDS